MPDVAAPPAAPQPGATPAPNPAPPNPVVDLAGSDAFGALESLASDNGKPDATPAGEKPGAQPRDPESGKFLETPKTGDQPKPAKPGKPAATAKPTATPQGEPVEFKNTKELKEHYERLKAEKLELENKYKAERTTWETQLAEAKKGDPAVTERLTKLQKQYDDTENELRFVRYESSNDFKERFEKPYIAAYQAGMNRAAALKIIERKDDSDPTNPRVLQQSRQGTVQDFDAIMSIVDDDLATEKAVELFGEKKAPLLLYHREEVMKANGVMRQAVKEYREKGTQWEKEQATLREQHQQAAVQMVEQIQTAAAEKFPTFFKPIENDTHGNELLEKGNHRIKRIIAGGAPLADGEKQWTAQEYAVEVAAFRNKGGAFDRLAHQNVQLRKQLKEISDKLKAYEESEPGDGEGRREAAGAGTDADDWATQLEKRATEKA
jgi:hypothetical protein